MYTILDGHNLSSEQEVKNVNVWDQAMISLINQPLSSLYEILHYMRVTTNSKKNSKMKTLNEDLYIEEIVYIF